MTLEDKYNMLKDRLHQMERVIIAFSGGVDSAFLLQAAAQSDMKDVLSVTGISESLPKDEYIFAIEFAESMHIRHTSVVTDEIDDVNYSDNPPDRCYYCKKNLFTRLKQIAERENFKFILDGTNADDAQDWRPGRRAAAEEGVISPLLEAGLSKNEIRELSRSAGLSTWNKPSTPCLSSRFPYGHKITSEALERVGKAERFIRKFGVTELRVRSQSETARIEILPEDFPLIMKDAVRNDIVDHLKTLGFKFVALDLRGFRSGSSNEIFSDNQERIS